MHGSYGVGPGQKKSAVIDNFVSSSPISAEEAAGEALNNSFGVGSYARRILEGMGWKEVKPFILPARLYVSHSLLGFRSSSIIFEHDGIMPSIWWPFVGQQ